MLVATGQVAVLRIKAVLQLCLKFKSWKTNLLITAVVNHAEIGFLCVLDRACANVRKRVVAIAMYVYT